MTNREQKNKTFDLKSKANPRGKKTQKISVAKKKVTKSRGVKKTIENIKSPKVDTFPLQADIQEISPKQEISSLYVLTIPKKQYRWKDFSYKTKLSFVYKSLAVLLLILGGTGFIYVQTHKLNQTLVIKQAVTKQVTPVVAGGAPIEWVKFVNRSDVTSKHYLLTVPKNASNIKITIVSKDQENITLKNPAQELSLTDRVNLNLSKPKIISFYNSPFSLFSYISNAFSGTAQASDGTGDVTVVNVLDVLDVGDATTSPVVNDGNVVDVGNVTSTDATQTNSDTNLNGQASTTSDSSTTTDATGTVVDVQNVLDVGNGNSTTPTATTTRTTPTTTTSTDVVQVTYTTPAPTITEQNTAKGKIVTVSADELSNLVCPPATFASQNLKGQATDASTTSVIPANAGIQASSTATDSLDSLLQGNDTGGGAGNTSGTGSTTSDSSSTASSSNLEVQLPNTTSSSPCTVEQTHLTNVLASAHIPKIYKVGQESKIHIKWLSNNDQDMQFHAYDTNSDGYLDYVEWTVPHLSTQTFEIIFISKALELDQNLNVVGDIYDQVKAQDKVFAPVPSGHTVRVTFNEFLTNQNDTTIYARPSQTSSSTKIEEYPVYTDQDGNETEGPLVATFPIIDHEGTYKILLNSLQKSTNLFDLKVTGDIDIDYIVDPSPVSVTDTFHDSSKIASMVNIILDTINGQVTLSTASSFTCGSALFDSRDGQSYSTVLIGSQCWMAQNLNVGTMVAGATNQGTSSSSIQKYCYSDTPSNCSTYGGLYQWNQAMAGSTTPGAQGICPNGWHIPTHDEYTTLELTVCTSGTCSTDFPYDTNTQGWRGTNEGTALKQGGSSGWNGLIAGARNTDGSFDSLGSYAAFWSSLSSGGGAWYRTLYSGFGQVYRFTYDAAYGFSVRCLKD